MNNSNLVNIKLLLQYDGSNYSGWQIQHNGVTIQGLITAALVKINQQPVKLYGAGRTDAGVHALGQVANFFTDKALTPQQWQKALNGHLPPDIRVIAASAVPTNFHARFSAIGKHYRYQLIITPTISPFDYRYYYHYPYSLNLDAMQQAASYLLGKHDFAAFATATKKEATTRIIHQLEIVPQATQIIFQLQGNGFLRYMVRTIVGTLLEVGRQQRDPASIPAILQAQDRRLAGPTAPPQGLFLVAVDYPKDVCNLLKID
jgi:tRNA pseudouridine38-40 synthase